jgi:hypothetical protein
MDINVGDIVEWGTGLSKLVGFVTDINEEEYTTTVCWFVYSDNPESYSMGALSTFKKVE